MNFTLKIQALKVAARDHSIFAERVVLDALSRGVKHMEYKDFAEFDCESKEQYIYQEAEHLIERFELEFIELSLIRGGELTDDQKKQLKFNGMSDVEWVNNHAFYFEKDAPSYREGFCYPVMNPSVEMLAKFSA